MNKRLLVLMGAVLLLINCSTLKRIKSSKHLFEDIAANYNLSDFDVFIEAKDRTIKLTNLKVTSDGKIIADEKSKSKSGKDKAVMLFYTKEDSEKIVGRITDSASPDMGRLIIGNDKIVKVKIQWVNDHGSVRKRIIYEKFWGLKGGLKIFLYFSLFLAAMATLLGIIYAAFYVMITVLFQILGCYIATMVYGSYDAPEVLVLRKYRDEKLAPYFWGRVFIGIYYTLSPLFVKVFKHNKPVNRFVKWILDKWVIRLRAIETAKIENFSNL